MDLSKIEHNSDLYYKALALRHEVLRAPLGMVHRPAELEHDAVVSYYILQQNGEVLGVVGMEKTDAATGRLKQMAVSSKLQGKGAGRKLVKFLEHDAAAMGLAEIHLEARLDAEGFYHKLGYSTTSEIYEKIGLAHVFMKKVF